MSDYIFFWYHFKFASTQNSSKESKCSILGLEGPLGWKPLVGLTLPRVLFLHSPFLPEKHHKTKKETHGHLQISPKTEPPRASLFPRQAPSGKLTLLNCFGGCRFSTAPRAGRGGRGTQKPGGRREGAKASAATSGRAQTGRRTVRSPRRSQHANSPAPPPLPPAEGQAARTAGARGAPGPAPRGRRGPGDSDPAGGRPEPPRGALADHARACAPLPVLALLFSPRTAGRTHTKRKLSGGPRPLGSRSPGALLTRVEVGHHRLVLGSDPHAAATCGEAEHGGQRGRAGAGAARGGCHLPCSSSLDEPELPSSQELLLLLPLGAAAAKLLFCPLLGAAAAEAAAEAEAAAAAAEAEAVAEAAAAEAAAEAAEAAAAEAAALAALFLPLRFPETSGPFSTMAGIGGGRGPAKVAGPRGS